MENVSKPQRGNMDNSPLLPWKKVMIGYSHQERAIPFYLSQLSGGLSLDLLIMGAMHGDEPESAQITNYILNECNFISSRVGLIPIVNPDGLANLQRANAAGVDLNRNFPTRDWQEERQSTRYYSGLSAASEPETQFIISVLQHYTPRHIVSIHTFYQMINTDGPADEIARKMSAVNGYPIQPNIGYPTPGSFGTYVGKECNIPTITLELAEGKISLDEIKKNVSAIKVIINNGYT